jgi:hypothetical protein
MPTALQRVLAHKPRMSGVFSFQEIRGVSSVYRALPSLLETLRAGYVISNAIA